MPIVEKRFRTLDAGFAFIEGFTNLERTNNTPIRGYRLDRMRALLEFFGNPQNDLRKLHIAGTKGKGSTGIYLAAILSEAGYRTGFYASPHVSSYTERITLAGVPFEDGVYVEMINKIASRLPELRENALPLRSNPTTFELLTLLGFLVFREQGCSWAVIETGIGGRLDATNVIMPEACILTPVEREHTELLGDTLPQIAGEKAGIIKEGVPAFSGYQHPDVRAVFETTAAARNAPLRFLADELEESSIRLHPTGSEVDLRWKGGTRECFELAMSGEVQADNSALAALTVRSLFSGSGSAGPPIDTEAIHRGLERARLPGRMEVLSLAAGRREVPVVLDAAHTPVSVARLIGSFRKLYPGDAVLIFGSVLGKDPAGMAAVLAPHFREILVSTPGTFKKSRPEEVWSHFVRLNDRSRLVREPNRALEAAAETALRDGLPILVTGSFYMIAEIRDLLLRSS